VGVVEPPKPGVWHNLLDREPVKLMKSTRNSVSQYDAGEKRFWWDAHDDCLFRLGSTDDDYEIEVTFTQSHLAGHRGLFLGYRRGSEKKGDLPRAVVVVVVPDGLKRGQGLLFQGTLLVNPGKTRFQQIQPLGAHVGVPQLAEKAFTLFVRVKGGQPDEVRVDDIPVAGLRNDLIPEDYLPLRGDFGIVADYDSARVTHARWKSNRKAE
jgi:hypothetical protein